VYVGNYAENEKSGQGQTVTPDGSTYLGQWRDGKKDDLQGVYRWANGDRYVGAFSDDEKNGKGVFTWPDGANYVGSFKDGMKAGRGE